jgi:N-acetylglucosamine kinase-like BadF-type ATPase
MGNGCFIGLDGGGTKTTAIVVDEALRVLGSGRGGPSNFLRVGLDAAAADVERAVRAACRAAEVEFGDVLFTYCGIAGADHPENREKMVARLSHLFPKGNFTVDSDACVALEGALGGAPGVVVIAGTGSVAFGRNHAGDEARAGGWGPTLGDEGSGYSIARRGLSAIVRAYDGRGPETLMTPMLCDHYGMCEPDELPLFVYAPTTHADDIAVYFKLVLEAARRGDAAAREIFAEEGNELGESAVAVARQLGICDARFSVAPVGGAFHAGPLLLDPMRERLAADCPRAEIVSPLASPVEGAAQLAMRSLETVRPERRP